MMPVKDSSFRLVFIVGMFWAMGLTTYAAFVDHSNWLIIGGLFGILTSTLVGGKVTQKAIEKPGKVAE